MESRSYFYPNILRFGIILSGRLLDILLTVLDNDTLVCLIYLNTEEVVEVTIHIFSNILENSKEKHTIFKWI